MPDRYARHLVVTLPSGSMTHPAATAADVVRVVGWLAPLIPDEFVHLAEWTYRP